MAFVTLTKLWLNVVETGVGMSAYTANGRTFNRSAPGEVRTYAGGRQRSIMSEGVKGSVPLTLRDLTLPQVTQLESWRGLTLCVRDHRGRLFYGVFYDTDVTEHKRIDLYDVAITVNEVTYDESV